MRTVHRQLPVERKARISPDRLVRIPRAHPAQERYERALVARLERIAAEQRESRNKGLVQLGKDLGFRLRRKGLAVVEIPRLRLEAVEAVVCAAGDEQRDPHADAVGNVTFLDLTVIHIRTSSLEQTRSASLPSEAESSASALLFFLFRGECIRRDMRRMTWPVLGRCLLRSRTLPRHF